MKIISYFEHNFKISDLEEKSHKQTLEERAKFRGTSFAPLTLVGTDPTESMKDLLDSDVISILLSNDLNVGRHLGNVCKYYVPRVVQHRIYVKKDIMKLQYKYIKIAVSGLQTDERKNTYLPEK
jgi:hypothetical protein